MKILDINKCSVAEAPGISVVLFVAGCLPNKCEEGNCPGCHNKEAQKFSYGKEFTPETKYEILEAVKQPYIHTFVLCGGEPLDQDLNELIDLIKSIKEQCLNRDIWCYTGYEWEQVKDLEIMQYIDVAVVGPFILEQRDISDANRWRGSRNQRVIDVKKSLEQNKKVFLEGIPNNN